MPNLMDIAKISMNKVQVNTPYKALNSVIDNNNATKKVTKQAELSLKNKLKTTVKIGNETQAYKMPEDSFGDFASWNKELEKTPKTDAFQTAPINKVKNNDKTDIKQEMLSYKVKEWLNKVDARISKLGYKA